MTAWNNDRELEFLEIYQSEPVLWDPKHPSHKDRMKIGDAWDRISEVLDIPVADLKKKKDSLMATFRMHRRKRRASVGNASSADDIYQPIWFAFELMNSFLGEGMVSNATENIASYSASLDEGDEVKPPTATYGDEVDKCSTERSSTPVALKTQLKRRKENPLPDLSRSLTDATSATDDSKRRNTASEHFGLYVGLEIEKIRNEIVKKRAILKIDRVLLDAFIEDSK